MAHELYIENGEAAMMYFGPDPWHRLGTKLDHPATAEEAIIAAKLDWEVEMIPLCAVADGISRPVKGQYAVVPAHRWKKLVCPIYGTVTSRYHPLQNRDAFRFFDAIVGEGAAVYQTAGALGGGERVWISAKLPDDIHVADEDITQKYLLLSNSHDGKSSVQVKFTPTRVVCNNTLVQALGGSGQTVCVAHTRDLKERLEQARRNLGIINTRYDVIAADFKQIVAVKMDSARLATYLKLVFRDPKEPGDESAAERVYNHRQRAAFLFENGRGNQLKSVAGTLWAAYNGIAEMIDHDPSKRDDDRQLTYMWFGKGAAVKVQACNEAKKLMVTEWKA